MKKIEDIDEKYIDISNISDEADFLSWSARFFVGKKIKDHGCPTCIPATFLIHARKNILSTTSCTL